MLTGLAVVLAVSAIIGVRRWVHHAELELIPVLVPPTADARSVLHPPASEIAARMERDVAELIKHPDRPKLAVLTFDDGPYPVESPALLAQLEALQVPADFFLIGRDAQRQPSIAMRLAGGGSEVGDHTMTHPEMSSMPFERQRDEVMRGEAAIRDVVGSASPYFRPPHGNYDIDTIRAAQAADLTMALWNDAPGDWRTLTPDAIAASVERQAKAPAVILLHSGKLATIEALPRIVADFRAAGFQFVTLSELQRRVPLDAINDPIKVKV